MNEWIIYAGIYDGILLWMAVLIIKVQCILTCYSCNTSLGKWIPIIKPNDKSAIYSFAHLVSCTGDIIQVSEPEVRTVPGHKHPNNLWPIQAQFVCLRKGTYLVAHWIIRIMCILIYGIMPDPQKIIIKFWGTARCNLQMLLHWNFFFFNFKWLNVILQQNMSVAVYFVNSTFLAIKFIANIVFAGINMLVNLNIVLF